MTSPEVQAAIERFQASVTARPELGVQLTPADTGPAGEPIMVEQNGAKTVAIINPGVLYRGTKSLAWTAPRKTGTYTVTVSATAETLREKSRVARRPMEIFTPERTSVANPFASTVSS